MGATACKHLQMFRVLCGDDALKNVVIVSTMWSEVNEVTGTQREKELLNCPGFWGDMIDKGAYLARYERTQKSVDVILDLLVEKPSVCMRLQRELVDQRKNLWDTAVGEFLRRELEAQINALDEEIGSRRMALVKRAFATGQQSAKVKAQLREAKLKRAVTKKELRKLRGQTDHRGAEITGLKEVTTERFGVDFWSVLLRSVYEGAAKATDMAHVVSDILGTIQTIRSH